MDAYTYRFGNASDIKQIQEVCLLSYGQYIDIVSAETWLKWKSNFENEKTFLDLLDISTCFVCTIEEKVIACAFLIPHGNAFLHFEETWCYIRLLGVHPKHVGKGIGKKITQNCMDYASEKGEKIIALHTSEFQNAARHIYESLGFKKQKQFLLYDKNYWIYTFEIKK